MWNKSFTFFSAPMDEGWALIIVLRSSRGIRVLSYCSVLLMRFFNDRSSVLFVGPFFWTKASAQRSEFRFQLSCHLLEVIQRSCIWMEFTTYFVGPYFGPRPQLREGISFSALKLGSLSALMPSVVCSQPSRLFCWTIFGTMASALSLVSF